MKTFIIGLLLGLQVILFHQIYMNDGSYGNLVCVGLMVASAFLILTLA